MSALLTGAPLNVELLLIISIAALQVVVVPVALIYEDAKNRNSSHAIAWAAAAFFGGIAVWVLYFVVREEVGPGESSPTNHGTTRQH
jgi:ABC-type glycerol-3-phosphate transport system permease component